MLTHYYSHGCSTLPVTIKLDDEAGTTAAATAIQYGKYWASCKGPSPPRTCQNGADIDRTPNTLWYYAPPHVDPSSKPPLLVQIHGGGFTGYVPPLPLTSPAFDGQM